MPPAFRNPHKSPLSTTSIAPAQPCEVAPRGPFAIWGSDSLFPRQLRCRKLPAQPRKQTQGVGLTASCSGTFSCRWEDGTFESTLHKEGTRCYAGTVELLPDGTTRIDDVEGHWSGDKDSFAVCDGDLCATCSRKETTTPGPSSRKNCRGSASSCYGMPGSCSSQRGCYLHFHFHLDGSSEAEFAGYPDECSEFSDQDSCEGQIGCSWE
jgi:hypothetical protein